MLLFSIKPNVSSTTSATCIPSIIRLEASRIIVICRQFSMQEMQTVSMRCQNILLVCMCIQCTYDTTHNRLAYTQKVKICKNYIRYQVTSIHSASQIRWAQIWSMTTALKYLQNGTVNMQKTLENIRSAKHWVTKDLILVPSSVFNVCMRRADKSQCISLQAKRF